MTRFVARHIAPEMLGLLLLEGLLAFSLAYAVGTQTAAGALEGHALNQAAVVAATVGLTSLLLGLYRPQLFLRTRSLLLSTTLGGAFAFPAVWAVLSTLGMRAEWIVGADRIWPAKILVVWIAALLAVRLGMMALVRSGLFAQRIAIAGSPAELARTLREVTAAPPGLFVVVQGGAALPDPALLQQQRVRTVLMSQPAHAALPPPLVAEAHRRGVELEPEAVFWERHLKRVDIDGLDPTWFAAIDRRPPGRLRPLVNRAGDIAMSLGLLMFTLPLMLLVAVLVRLDSPGPTLYRQERVGLGGLPFTLLKFRSMRQDAETRGPAWAQMGDPRVTRVGTFLRRARIDELPQLLNVLRGEMSFIGPRPERPHFVGQLAELIPFYAERSRVKPGLTGWAQVNYPYGASVEDAQAKLSYDLFYVRHRTVFLDLAILFATVRVILFQEGAR